MCISCFVFLPPNVGGKDPRAVADAAFCTCLQLRLEQNKVELNGIEYCSTKDLYILYIRKRSPIVYWGPENARSRRHSTNKYSTHFDTNRESAHNKRAQKTPRIQTLTREGIFPNKCHKLIAHAARGNMSLSYSPQSVVSIIPQKDAVVVHERRSLQNSIVKRNWPTLTNAYPDKIFRRMPPVEALVNRN